MDSICEEAKRLIRGKIENPNADIHFAVGGTPANLICLTAFLRPYESIIATNSAHISEHETGAIEAAGHKICTA